MTFSRPCLASDCPLLVRDGGRFCVAHQAAAERRRPHKAAYRDPAYRETRAYLLAGGVCVECGGRQDLTVDHIRPLAVGGTNDPANLQIMCRNCNSRKGAR